MTGNQTSILRSYPINGRDRETLVRLAYLARRCCQNQGY